VNRYECAVLLTLLSLIAGGVSWWVVVSRADAQTRRQCIQKCWDDGTVFGLCKELCK
jgi:hypothetical protein